MLFLEQQILYDPIMASLVVSLIRDFVTVLDKPTICRNWLNPLMLGKPRDPTSIVKKVVAYPDPLMRDTSSWYFTSFLLASSSRSVSKGIVNSSSVTDLVAFHNTMSSLWSVAARYCGKLSLSFSPFPYFSPLLSLSLPSSLSLSPPLFLYLPPSLPTSLFPPSTSLFPLSLRFMDTCLKLMEENVWQLLEVCDIIYITAHIVYN